MSIKTYIHDVLDYHNLDNHTLVELRDAQRTEHYMLKSVAADLRKAREKNAPTRVLAQEAQHRSKRLEALYSAILKKTNA